MGHPGPHTTCRCPSPKAWDSASRVQHWVTLDLGPAIQTSGRAGWVQGPVHPLTFPLPLQRCLRDILDGFFPSELQRLYPNGVPFKVSDLRNQVYLEDGLDPFPGEGRVVGRQRMHKAWDRAEEHPGSRMTAEKFLNRLPKFVIRQGEVIDIRGPIRDTLQVRPTLTPPALLGEL